MTKTETEYIHPVELPEQDSGMTEERRQWSFAVAHCRPLWHNTTLTTMYVYSSTVWHAYTVQMVNSQSIYQMLSDLFYSQTFLHKNVKNLPK